MTSGRKTRRQGEKEHIDLKRWSSFRSVVLKLEGASESPGLLIKTSMVGFHP